MEADAPCLVAIASGPKDGRVDHAQACQRQAYPVASDKRTKLSNSAGAMTTSQSSNLGPRTIKAKAKTVYHATIQAKGPGDAPERGRTNIILSEKYICQPNA